MTIKELGWFLVERDTDHEGDKARALADRLVLRIFSQPSLLAFLTNVNVHEHKIELDFQKLPDKVLHNVVNLIGEPDVKVYKYSKNGHEHVGFTLDVEPDKQPL
jgi:hypothetical protein